MRHPSVVKAALGAAVACFGLSVAASAQSVGVNFVGGGGPNPGSSLAPTDIAGVVPQAHFNNATGASGTLSGLLDSSGNNSGATLTFSSPNTWSSGTSTATPNGALLNGYIDSGGSAATGATVTVTNVPFKAYDLIVYFNTDNTGSARVGDYEVVTPGGTLTQQVSYINSSSLILAPPYPDNSVPTTATTLGGTWLMFPGLTSSTLTLKTDQASLPGVNFRAPISGFQLYGIAPEPASLGTVVALGGLALGRSRRRTD